MKYLNYLKDIISELSIDWNKVLIGVTLTFVIFIIAYHEIWCEDCEYTIDNLIVTEDERLIEELYTINIGLSDSLDLLMNDIFWAIDYIDTLETQLEEEKKNIKIVEKEVIVYQTITDTIYVTQGGFDVNTLYNIPFNGVKYQNGSALRVFGNTSFKWDFLENKPIDITTAINNYDLNMNLVTDIVQIQDNLMLNTFAVTPEINITSHKGNILTEDDFVIKRPARLGVGLVGGVGFSYQGMTPYVGIGVTYSFYDITELFKK